MTPRSLPRPTPRRARRLLGAAGTLALLTLATACGGDADADTDAAGMELPDGLPVATSDATPCEDLFVEGTPTMELLAKIPTDAQGFQVCGQDNITNQFQTSISSCVNEPDRRIHHNPFGYGFEDGTWELVAEGLIVSAELPTC